MVVDARTQFKAVVCTMCILVACAWTRTVTVLDSIELNTMTCSCAAPFHIMLLYMHAYRAVQPPVPYLRDSAVQCCFWGHMGHVPHSVRHLLSPFTCAHSEMAASSMARSLWTGHVVRGCPWRAFCQLTPCMLTCR